MIATAATAKFSVAYLSPANTPATNASNHPGNFFDWTTLSMTTLMGQGWRTSAKVSPTTASSASVSAFQCGRRRVVMRISVNGVDGDNRVHKRRNGGNGETNGADGAFEPETSRWPPHRTRFDGVAQRRTRTNRTGKHEHWNRVRLVFSDPIRPRQPACCAGRPSNRSSPFVLRLLRYSVCESVTSVISVDSRRCAARDVHQLVVRIDMIDVLGRDELMLHEDRRRHRSSVQDVERDVDDLGAILFWKVRDRPNQPCARLAQLGAAFGRRVLSHDGARFGAAGFLKGAQRAERARIVDRADEETPRAAHAEMFPHRLEAVA